MIRKCNSERQGINTNERLINIDNNLGPETIRRKGVGLGKTRDRQEKGNWAAYNTTEPVTSQMKYSKLKTELFSATVIPALFYGTETWRLTKALRKQLKPHWVGLRPGEANPFHFATTLLMTEKSVLFTGPHKPKIRATARPVTIRNKTTALLRIATCLNNGSTKQPSK
ncbi:hypothetical protein ANCDUO_03033 [Ancylostoma duodenale]|uniref:Uncharacterized protein n=1 Tax=Ancylostoma duodenale TaxID=51022 RepID=A0A0C2H511_9BILA|nr:hypothetical protein ANCDUO_03033 [Ancylostoma duodenale]